VHNQLTARNRHYLPCSIARIRCGMRVVHTQAVPFVRDFFNFRLKPVR